MLDFLEKFGCSTKGRTLSEVLQQYPKQAADAITRDAQDNIDRINNLLQLLTEKSASSSVQSYENVIDLELVPRIKLLLSVISCQEIIFTIGYTESYDNYFKEQVCPEKLGRTDNYRGKFYQGGCVWKTYEEALKNCPAGYSVYGVIASWERDTEKSTEGDYHDLLVTSKLLKLK